jgi:hypothetical protein
MVTPFTSTVSPGFGELAVAAAVGREGHDHRARLHTPNDVGGDQPGREDAADERGRDHHVGGRALIGQHLTLAELVLFAELLA